MRYVLAIVLPPVAFFTMGKPFQGILNLILMVTIIGWLIDAQTAALADAQTAAIDAQTAAIVAQTAAITTPE